MCISGKPTGTTQLHIYMSDYQFLWPLKYKAHFMTLGFGIHLVILGTAYNKERCGHLLSMILCSDTSHTYKECCGKICTVAIYKLPFI